MKYFDKNNMIQILLIGKVYTRVALAVNSYYTLLCINSQTRLRSEPPSAKLDN